MDLLEHLMIVNRCKCDFCQNEKIRRQEQVLEEKKKVEEEKKTKECPFCKERTSDYQWMFLEQREISAGYKKILEEQEAIIRKWKLNK